MKLDKDKKYIFKKELLLKDLEERKQPLDVGMWADVVNNKEVTIIEDGKKAEWKGNVSYTVGRDPFNRNVKQTISEKFILEPEWLEEKIDEQVPN